MNERTICVKCGTESTTGTCGCFVPLQTDEERKAGVVPKDVSYPPGDIRRYGGKHDEEFDNAEALEALITLGYPVPYGLWKASKTIELRKALALSSKPGV